MTDLPALRELLRRSVRTLAAIPDSNLRDRYGPRTAWPEFVRFTRDAYGAAPPRFKTFVPTSQDLSVYLDALSWISWYQRSQAGAETVRVFNAWCFGAAMWQLQERVSTNRRRPASPRTVYYRMDTMVLAIACKFPEATRKCVDNHPELQTFAHAGIESDALSSDARNLPRSPKMWRHGAPVPLSMAEQAAAHGALEKRLRRNGSKALRRAGK